MLFSIIVKVIVTLYALLMVFASIKEFNSKDRLGNTVNIISGIAIFLSNFLENEYFKIISIIGLLVFIVTAIINGLQNHAFHIKHHIARFIITIIFIILIIYIWELVVLVLLQSFKLKKVDWWLIINFKQLYPLILGLMSNN